MDWDTGSTDGTGGRTGRDGRPGYMELGQPILGRPHEKCTFLLKKAVLVNFDQFWPFLDLLDLKNGSGSKFCIGWYRGEVWKRKMKRFHAKSLKLQHFCAYFVHILHVCCLKIVPRDFV